MRLLPRTTRGTLWLAAAAWLTGMPVLWRLVPPRPRAEWPLPPSAMLATVTGDGRTFLTIQREPIPGSEFVRVTGPIRLWDVGTGTLRATYLAAADHVARVTPSPDGR